LVLSVNGSDTPAEQTGAQGRAVRNELAPEVAYAVHEVLMPGWQALTETANDLGLPASGAILQIPFINFMKEWHIYIPLFRRKIALQQS